MKKIRDFSYILLCMAVLAGCSKTEKPGEYSRNVPIMGTFLQIKAAAAGYSREELKTIVDGALDQANMLEKKFDLFDPESEVNTLNMAKEQKVSRELFGLVRSAGRIGRVTAGRFDITVAPILKTEGFYKDMPGEILDRIPEGYEGVGWENIILAPDGESIVLRGDTWIDLSGIAKGYIVDRISKNLRENGITDFLINAGGDIYCAAKGTGGAWRIGIRNPSGRNIAVTLAIRDMAVATSGDYENVVMDKDTGETISHIIDSSVDKAISKNHSSVTVIAPTCEEADALATGMMAMQESEAIALADTLENVEIITAVYDKGMNSVNFSQGAAKYVLKR